LAKNWQKIGKNWQKNGKNWQKNCQKIGKKLATNLAQNVKKLSKNT
jgi:hypothetical protein